jgi:protein SCO1/2
VRAPQRFPALFDDASRDARTGGAVRAVTVPQARPPLRAARWPWLVLGAVLIAVLGLRVLSLRIGSPELPILARVPSFTLTDQRGTAITSGDLTGKVWIASFIYTTCPGPCPRVVQRVADVQRRLGDEADLRFVSFSVDPAADTPEVLAAYGESRGIEPERWKLVTGSVPAVVDLVRRGFLLAVERADDTDPQVLASEGPVVHDLRLALVDRDLQVRGYYDSTDPEAVDRLVGDARRLLRARG